MTGGYYKFIERRRRQRVMYLVFLSAIFLTGVAVGTYLLIKSKGI